MCGQCITVPASEFFRGRENREFAMSTLLQLVGKVDDRSEDAEKPFPNASSSNSDSEPDVSESVSSSHFAEGLWQPGQIVPCSATSRFRI